MRSPSAADVHHDLVLVGGGHAHIQVLRRWAMSPVPGTRLTLVVDRPIAVYSGMVPGFVAGQYSREDLEIDVRPLALRARPIRMENYDTPFEKLRLYLDGQSRTYEMLEALRHLEYVCGQSIKRASAQFRQCLSWEDQSARDEVARQCLIEIGGWINRNKRHSGE